MRTSSELIFNKKRTTGRLLIASYTLFPVCLGLRQQYGEQIIEHFQVPIARVDAEEVRSAYHGPVIYPPVMCLYTLAIVSDSNPITVKNKSIFVQLGRRVKWHFTPILQCTCDTKTIFFYYLFIIQGVHEDLLVLITFHEKK